METAILPPSIHPSIPPSFRHSSFSCALTLFHLSLYDHIDIVDCTLLHFPNDSLTHPTTSSTRRPFYFSCEPNHSNTPSTQSKNYRLHSTFTFMVGWDDKGVYRIKRGASLLAQSSDASSSAGNEFVQFKCKLVFCPRVCRHTRVFAPTCPPRLQGNRAFDCASHSRRKKKKKSKYAMRRSILEWARLGSALA